MNTKISYLLLRIAIGTSMFGHGLVRLPKLQMFSEGMLKQFENSMLPEILVLPFTYILPFAEFLCGLFLILGLFTRNTAIVASLILISLLFGATLIENWNAIGLQLIHIAFFVYLIHNIDHNSYAIDSIKKATK